jgi:hypothetical protein
MCSVKLREGEIGREGEVWIKRRDGRVIVIRPEPVSGSQLDIEGMELGVSPSEILEAIQEGRRVYRMNH